MHSRSLEGLFDLTEIAAAASNYPFELELGPRVQTESQIQMFEAIFQCAWEKL